jgi:hypothetical protein
MWRWRCPRCGDTMEALSCCRQKALFAMKKYHKEFCG